VLRPGEASELIVMRIANEEFARMPLTLRMALEKSRPGGGAARRCGSEERRASPAVDRHLRVLIEVP
jgi:hypothetical protein